MSYPEPIIENGLLARDMVMLRLTYKLPFNLLKLDFFLRVAWRGTVRKKEVVMNKNKQAQAWRWRRGLFPILLAFIDTFLLGLALSGCTKLEVTPPDYSLRLSENKHAKAV